ncbi:hypothetical protein DER46DRAFT_578529 [Fusarium sp. MPI-SDFR-AT-0072]|nr:hypothetical protein DER46DRAFT_578529 [Fusarium sp. MPI-SDFR-AT-0072]
MEEQGQDKEFRALQPTSVPQQLSYAGQRPWIERTGWDQTYSDKDHREVLAALIAMNNCPCRQSYLLARRGTSRLTKDLVSSAEDEMKIVVLVKLVDLMLDRCEETAQKTSRSILCWLRSTRALSTYPKPFTLKEDALNALDSKISREDINDGVRGQGANDSAEDEDEDEDDKTKGEDKAINDRSQENDGSVANATTEASIDDSSDIASEDSDSRPFADETERNCAEGSV